MGFDKRFREVDEMTAATLRFPQKRLASFTCSFGAADTAAYEVIGTKGTLRVTQAYEFSEPIKMEIAVGDKSTRRTFAKRDQFGPEIVYFSNCILNDCEPEPSGCEGWLMFISYAHFTNQHASEEPYSWINFREIGAQISCRRATGQCVHH